MTAPQEDWSSVTLDIHRDRVRIVPVGHCSTKVAATDHIARTLAETYRCPATEKWADRMRRREALGTTGIGRHFALLHDFQRPGERVKTSGPDFDLWTFLIPTGIDWDALDGEPVHVIACPVFRRGGEHPGYLPVLSAVHQAWARITPAENVVLSGMTPADAERWFNACVLPGAEVSS